MIRCEHALDPSGVGVADHRRRAAAARVNKQPPSLTPWTLGAKFANAGTVDPAFGARMGCARRFDLNLLEASTVYTPVTKVEFPGLTDTVHVRYIRYISSVSGTHAPTDRPTEFPGHMHRPRPTDRCPCRSHKLSFRD